MDRARPAAWACVLGGAAIGLLWGMVARIWMRLMATLATHPLILARVTSFISAHRRPFTALGWAAAILLGMMLGFIPGGVLVLLALIALRWLHRSRLLPRLRYSIRSKFLAAITVVVALFSAVSVINMQAMSYMHERVHALLDVGSRQPDQLIAGVQALDETQHGLLFSLAPVFGLLATLIAASLGLAMARSVVVPVRRMNATMRRLAAGDLSERVDVENNDELGDLAARINRTAGALADLQAARLAQERARAREEALQERMAQVTRAQEEERRRIARELHDGLGPSLAAIGNQLRASRAIVRSDPAQAEAELEEVERGLRDHVRQIRELIYDLRPPALDQLGLAEAVRQYAERFARDAGVDATVRTDGDLALDPLAEVTIFRVMQECLSNVHRHAGAKCVELSLERADGRVTLTVADDGRGFDYQAVTEGAVGSGSAERDAEGAGLGLLGMRERAALVGGELDVSSASGTGTRVVLQLPAGIPSTATAISP